MRCFLIIACIFSLFPEESILAGGLPRYISIAPATTEILFALGLDAEIVGVSSYCNYPDGAKSKKKIGDFSNPNIEIITSLRPDYIFAAGLEQDVIAEKLKKRGFNVFIQDPTNMQELYVTIMDMGRITKREKQAGQVVNSMKAAVSKVTALVNKIPLEKRKKVFIEIWHNPLMTAGKGSFIDDIVALAGGINIARDVTRPYSNFSAEKVLSSDPDLIFMTYMDSMAPLDAVMKRSGWRNISAVRNKKVFNDIAPDTLLRPGPRVVEGLAMMYERLYQ